MEWHEIYTRVASALSIGTIAGALIGVFPAVAAFVALLFYFIQIYESETVKHWLANRRKRKIAYLKARVAGLEAYDRQKPPEA